MACREVPVQLQLMWSWRRWLQSRAGWLQSQRQIMWSWVRR